MGERSMKKSYGSDSSSKMHRNLVEKNRRIEMNRLCSNLTSLVPRQHFKPSKDMLSQVDQIEQTTNYIVQLRERVDKLKAKKQQLEKMIIHEDALGTTSSKQDLISDDKDKDNDNTRSLPIIELSDFGGSLEVQLVTKLHTKRLLLSQVIKVLEEEGAIVVNVSFSTLGHKVFHTLHAQALSSRIGVETSRVHERLQELIS